MYTQTILPLVEYVSYMLFFNRNCDVDKLQKLQNRCLRMCFDVINPRNVSVKRLHAMANICPLEEILNYLILGLILSKIIVLGER